MLNVCGKLIDAGNSYSEASRSQQPTTVFLISISFVQTSNYNWQQFLRAKLVICMLTTTRSTTISNDEVFLGLINESTNSTSKK